MPVRTCVGCRARAPQTELVRCTLGPDDRPVVSRTAPGRGAWIHPHDPACLAQAGRARRLERAWRRPVPADALDILTHALATTPTKG